MNCPHCGKVLSQSEDWITHSKACRNKPDWGGCVANHLGPCVAIVSEACLCHQMTENLYLEARQRILDSLRNPNLT
jgi:hypothetical protein